MTSTPKIVTSSKSLYKDLSIGDQLQHTLNSVMGKVASKANMAELHRRISIFFNMNGLTELQFDLIVEPSSYNVLINGKNNFSKYALLGIFSTSNAEEPADIEALTEPDSRDSYTKEYGRFLGVSKLPDMVDPHALYYPTKLREDL